MLSYIKRILPLTNTMIFVTTLAYATPTLPQNEIDIALPTITGQTCTARTAAELTTCLLNVSGWSLSQNHEIVLTAGNTFDGSFILPARTGATGWVIIRSTGTSSLPLGIRVNPTKVPAMATVRTTLVNTPSIRASSNASHYRLIGLEITQTALAHNYSLVVTGEAPSGITGTSDFIIDRCYIHGSATSQLRRGIYMDAQGGRTAVIDSYIENIHETGADNQAILAVENPGPILIQNNYLSSAGEIVMFGGADPSSATYLPQDITIKRNHLQMDPTWMGVATWSVKTLIEFKLGKRILMEGNILEYLWPGDLGYGWRLTVRNQNGTAPFSELSDLTIRYNTTRHVGNGFSFFGSDDTHPSLPVKHILIEHNLWYDMAGQWTTAAAGQSKFWVWAAGGTPAADDVIFRHNTVINSTSGSCFYIEGTGQTNLIFQDNIIHHGTYGVYRSGGAIGTAALNAQFGTSYVFTNNLIVGMAPVGVRLSSYPNGNFTVNTFSDVGFEDPAVNNYRLNATSPFKAGNKYQASDGTDMGVNIDHLRTLQGGSATILPPPQSLKLQR